MLNVRAYLSSNESYDSLPESLTADITIDGDNSYIAGIPEELIQPVENSEQSNEDDGVIQDDNQAMNEKREAVAESEKDSSEETEENQGDSTEDNQAEAEEEKKPDEEGDTDSEELRKKEEEDEVADIQYAIESYTKILNNGPVSVQAAAFLEVGLTALEKRRGILTVSSEAFDSSPIAIHSTINIQPYEARCSRIVETLPIL